MRATFANAFAAPADIGRLLLTDEIAVAAAAPAGTRVSVLDGMVDPDRAHALNHEMWGLAYAWFRSGDGDPTLVDGISVGDIAGAEAAITLFLPAARGVLEAQVVADAHEVDGLTLVVAAGGRGHHSRVETVQAESLAVALASRRPLVVDRVASRDPRNEALFAKFARTRDPDSLPREPRLRVRARNVVAGAVNLRGARAGRRAALAVLEYNPTQAFARSYAVDPRRALRLVRIGPSPGDLRDVLRRGDRALIPAMPLAGADPSLAAMPDRLQELSIAGVSVGRILEPYLRRLLAQYAPVVSALASRYRQELERSRVKAVLVPYDTPPLARVLVRVAQSMDIPTLHLNDGYKADDFQREGFAADRALAWSRSICENYYGRRRPNVTVTGNPKADVRPRRRSPRPARTKVLVGGFTFSPVDLNCRRSDPETFLDQVLDGIGKSAIVGPQVTVKLHPADEPAPYAEILSRYAALAPLLVAHGDVTAMFDDADVYVTTYSTSLLEAVAAGLPVLYYRVNEQRLQPPFSGDRFLEQRTAASPAELAALLDHPPAEFSTEDERLSWCEQYLGPLDGGSVVRVLAEIEDAARIAVLA